VQGNSARFSALYREHASFVWRTLRRFGVQGSNLEDATQDTFVVAHRLLDDFDDESPRAWLAAIARRIAADMRRRRAHSTLCARESQHDLALCREALRREDAQQARHAAAKLVHQLLDGLDDEKREVFVLAELEGMSMPEVARATELNLNTAYSRLRAARLQMKAEYARLVAREKWRMP
jgi:RNA polymerase sigma-70 factor (ECF subfamily)